VPPSSAQHSMGAASTSSQPRRTGQSTLRGADADAEPGPSRRAADARVVARNKRLGWYQVSTDVEGCSISSQLRARNVKFPKLLAEFAIQQYPELVAEEQELFDAHRDALERRDRLNPMPVDADRATGGEVDDTTCTTSDAAGCDVATRLDFGSQPLDEP
jgi:hypothetical protein